MIARSRQPVAGRDLIVEKDSPNRRKHLNFSSYEIFRVEVTCNPTTVSNDSRFGRLPRIESRQVGCGIGRGSTGVLPSALIRYDVEYKRRKRFQIVTQSMPALQIVKESLMSRHLAVAIGIALVVSIFSIAAFAQGRANQQPSSGVELQGGEQPKPRTEGSVQLPDLNAKASYGFGLNIGRGLREQCAALQIDPQLVARGIADGLSPNENTQPLLTDEEIAEVMEAFEAELLERELKAQETMAAANEELAKKNKADGQAYRKKNAQNAAVKTTKSGIQYQVLEKGNGPTPKLTSSVQINYKGTLIDGTVFDSTEKIGPQIFSLMQLIEGWKQALQMMKVGDKWRLVIPSELAYGDAGTPGGPIPPGATLIFEIELLGVSDQ